MPLPIAEDCYYVRYVWTDPGFSRPATCGQYFEDEAGTGSEALLYAAIDANVTAGMWTVVTSDARIGSVVVTKLDGFSAGLTYTPAAVAKWAGAGGTDPIPQGCAVVSILSAQRGPTGRNRMYLPWVGEVNQDAGALNTGNVATMQAAWTTFANAMDTAGYRMVQIGSSAEVTQVRPVRAVTVRPYLKTQRRRARR